MQIPFTKMNGLGNDYVYIDCTKYDIKEPERLSKRISSRNFSVGSDGLILICPSEKADFYMRMFNADGSEGKMCGNGIRCVGKYVYDKGMTSKTELLIETLSGIKELKLNIDENTGAVDTVKVNMGKAILEPKAIPLNMEIIKDGLCEGEAGKCSDICDGAYISKPFYVGKEYYDITCVSMGNPHCVIFTGESVENIELEAIGPLIERHALFPERVNTEFVNIVTPGCLRMRVWERGSGETMACGTGACAVAVAAVLNGICKYGEDIRVILNGGELYINYSMAGEVFMTGKAETSFEGVIEI